MNKAIKRQIRNQQNQILYTMQSYFFEFIILCNLISLDYSFVFDFDSLEILEKILSSLKYHEQFLQVEPPLQENREQQEYLKKFDFGLDYKNPLSQDLSLLFGIEHQLQRFDRWLIGIDIDQECPPPPQKRIRGFLLIRLKKE